MDKAKSICGICQKAYTRNGSLRRHKLNAHFSNTFNCLTCEKKFKRQEDMAKHAKVCLKEKLELNDDKNVPFAQLNHPNKNDGLDEVRGDLAISSDSDNDSDPEINIMAHHLERQLIGHSTRNVQTNTESVRVHTCEKATNTEPLIVLSPDELLHFQDGLTIASFTESVKIFIDTINSNIVMSKPRLETPPDPSTQIGLLSVQPTSSKGNQFPVPPLKSEYENPEVTNSVSDVDSSVKPSTNTNTSAKSPKLNSTRPPVDIIISDSDSDSDSDSENLEYIKMCSRKPTRPVMFVPKNTREALKAKLMDIPSCSKK